MTDINNAGQVALYGFGGEAAYQSFIYSNGRYVDIGNLDDSAGFTIIAGLNEQDWGVGSSMGLEFPGIGQAFLYRDGRMQNFNDLLRPQGAARWNVITAAGINDRGQIVVATLKDGGNLKWFLATPVPEPGTWALMLCGLSTVGWRWRRAHPAAA